MAVASLPARGVWIEICGADRPVQERQSLPARGVWIEICLNGTVITYEPGRSPQGECGLKYPVLRQAEAAVGRSPQGECGLK